MTKPGTRVYVNALHSSGVAVVLRVRRDGRLVVRLPDGTRARVRADQVRPIDPPRLKPPPLLVCVPPPPRAFVQLSPEACALVAQPKPSTPRDRAYLDWLRDQPCVACAFPHGCDPSHHGKHGLGIKAPDHDAVSMCRRCHDHWELGAPRRVFGRDDLDDEATAAWLKQRAQKQRAEYERRRHG